MKAFDLEKALAGEPVVTRNGEKAFLFKDLSSMQDNIGLIMDKPLVGMIYSNRFVYTWYKDGRITHAVEEATGDIVGMWEEPRPTVKLTLPCPLKEPRDNMWFIDSLCEQVKESSCDSTMYMNTFNRHIYFASQEDAQAWIDAMKNSRR